MALIREKSKAQKKQDRQQMSSEIRTEMKKGKFAREAVKTILSKRRKNAGY